MVSRNGLACACNNWSNRGWAPGCLEYQVRRDALEPDLWLVCSQWREAQQMFDYLAGGIQQVFAEVLWRSLAASLEVQDDAG